jgi:hypothetical protein
MGSLARLHRSIKVEVEVGRKKKIHLISRVVPVRTVCCLQSKGGHVRDLRERELACTELLHGRDHPVLFLPVLARPSSAL